MKAFELADAEEQRAIASGASGSLIADELRRLADVNAELLDILDRLIEADKHGALDSAMFAYAEKFSAKAKEQS